MPFWRSPALLAISAAYYLSTQRNTTPQVQGAALLPSLAGEMNAVTAVTIRKGGSSSSLTVHKTADQWTVAERNDYPADVAKLRKVLMALSDAKIVEEKTSDPARYPVIGVEDPAQPGATGTEITVLAEIPKQAVIVGKSVGEGQLRTARRRQAELQRRTCDLRRT